MYVDASINIDPEFLEEFIKLVANPDKIPDDIYNIIRYNFAMRIVGDRLQVRHIQNS